MTTVKITRTKHCLENQSLEVLGKMMRKGQTQLLVLLPDGSKTLMPASWTDFASGGAKSEHSAPGVLGRLDDLVAIRALVDRLAQSQAAQQSSHKEDNRAAQSAQSDARPDSSASRGADQPAPRRSRRYGDNDLGRPDCKSSDGQGGGK